MGDVKQFPALGKNSRQISSVYDREDQLMAQELMAIANKLHQLAPRTAWPKWIGALGAEVRRAAKACLEG